MKQEIMITTYDKYLEVRDIFMDLLVKYLTTKNIVPTDEQMLEAGVTAIMAYLSYSDEGKKNHKKEFNMPNNPVDDVILQLEDNYKIEYNISREDWERIASEHEELMKKINKEIDDITGDEVN